MKKYLILFLLFFMLGKCSAEWVKAYEYKIIRSNHRLTETQLNKLGDDGWELCNYYENDPIDPVKIKWNEDPLNKYKDKWGCVLKTIYIYTFKRTWDKEVY